MKLVEYKNCVCYAQMYAGICNYAYKVNDLYCHAKPVVGYVSLCGINLCMILKSLMPNN